MKAWGNLPSAVTSYLENRHEMMGLGPIQWEHLVEYSKRQLAKRTSKTANKKLLPAVRVTYNRYLSTDVCMQHTLSYMLNVCIILLLLLQPALSGLF